MVLINVCFVLAIYTVLYKGGQYIIYYVVSLLVIFLVFFIKKKIYNRNLLDTYEHKVKSNYVCIIMCVFISVYLVGIARTTYIKEECTNIKDTKEKITNLIGIVTKIEEKDNTYALSLKSKKHKILAYINKNKVLRNGQVCVNIGSAIEINTELSKFETNSNLGQFNEYKYYTEQLKYDYKCYIDYYTLLNNYNDSNIYYKICQLLYKLKCSISKRINVLYGKTESAAVLNAMILGDKHLLGEDIREIYSTAGISHILAISGLHISLIGMSLYKLLKKLGINMYIASIFSMIIIILYGIMTGMSISTYRAVFLVCATLMAKFFYKTVDIGNITLISLFILMFYNPFLVENVSLQLSYLAIVAITTVSNVIEETLLPNIEFIRNREKFYMEKDTGNINDDRVIMSIGDGVNKIYRYILKGVSSGTSIMLLTLPVIVNSFYEIKLFSIGVNIVVLPLVPLMIILALISLICSAFNISCSMYLVGGVDSILKLYNWLGNILDKLSFNNIIVGHRHSLVILIYYIIVIVGLLLLKKYKNKRSLIQLIVCVMLVIIISNDNYKYLRVSMLDVSQGDCECIITPDNKVILIDGGSSDEKEVYKYRLMPYLKYMGVSTIDYIFLSHMDEDHINGIIDLLCDNTFKVNNLVLTKAYKENSYYELIQSIVKLKKINTLSIQTNDIIKMGDVLFRCIHPDGDYISIQDNEYSMTLLLTYKKFNMLFTGDVEADGEKIVANRLSKEHINIEALKVAHHGSKSSSSSEFIDILKPKYALISAGKNNPYGHPHKETIDNLTMSNSKVLVTAKLGEIDILCDGKSIKMMTF